MALQSSGQITLNDIATEFGGAVPHALSEYYGVATGIPASGMISVSDFYGASASSGSTTGTLTPEEDGSLESTYTYLTHDRIGFGAEGKCDFYYPESVGTTYDDAFGSFNNTTGLISNVTVTAISTMRSSLNSSFGTFLVQAQGTATKSSFSSIAVYGYLPAQSSFVTRTLNTNASNCFFSEPYRLATTNGLTNMHEWAWLVGNHGTGTTFTDSAMVDIYNMFDYATTNSLTLTITVT